MDKGVDEERSSAQDEDVARGDCSRDGNRPKYEDTSDGETEQDDLTDKEAKVNESCCSPPS